MKSLKHIAICVIVFIAYLNLHTKDLEQKHQAFSIEKIPQQISIKIISDTIPGNTSQKCAVKYSSYKLMATIHTLQKLECGDILTIPEPKIRAVERNRNFDIQTYDEYLFRQGYVGNISIKKISKIDHSFSFKRYIYRAKLPLIESIKKNLTCKTCSNHEHATLWHQRRASRHRTNNCLSPSWGHSLTGGFWITDRYTYHHITNTSTRVFSLDYVLASYQFQYNVHDHDRSRSINSKSLPNDRGSLARTIGQSPGKSLSLIMYSLPSHAAFLSINYF